MRFEFRDMRSEAELREARRLRAEVYVDEKGWLAPDQLVDGLDVDEHDEVSIHGGAFDADGRLVGTFRVIRDTAGLPIEELFGVELDPGAVSAELSRLVVRPSARSCGALIGLCRWVYQTCLDEGIDDAYAILEMPLLSCLQALGFPFEIIGASRWVYESENVPTRCRTRDVVAAVERADRGRETKLAPSLAAFGDAAAAAA